MGLPENVSIDLNTLIDLTEVYCIENNLDTTEHVDHTDEIADYIADQIDVNRDQDMLGIVVQKNMNATQEEFDKFYEQNQMLLNEPIEKNSENMVLAMKAADIFELTRIIDLSDGRILITFPEYSFDDIYEAPYKVAKKDRLRKGYTEEMV